MALIFDSTMGNRPSQHISKSAQLYSWAPKLPENITRPADDTALCFMPVRSAVCGSCTRTSGWYTAIHMEAMLQSDKSDAKLPCKLLSIVLPAWRAYQSS